MLVSREETKVVWKYSQSRGAMSELGVAAGLAAESQKNLPSRDAKVRALERGEKIISNNKAGPLSDARIAAFVRSEL